MEVDTEPDEAWVKSTLDDIQKLAVDLAMSEGFNEFRPVQWMSCEEIVKDIHKNVVVKATMGSGKTMAMAACNLSLQHLHHLQNSEAVVAAAPVCFVIVRQKQVGITVLGECLRMLPQHDIYTNFKQSGDLRGWVKENDSDADYNDVEFQEMTDKVKGTVCKEMEDWLVCVYQSDEQPPPSARSEKASLMSPARRQRILETDFGAIKRRKTCKSSIRYQRPKVLPFDAWRTRDPQRAATVIMTYSNLKAIGKYFAGSLSKVHLVMLDECHAVANNNKTKVWKSEVTKLCKMSERVYMFSGTPIAPRRDAVDEDAFLDEFRCSAHRILWSERHALSKGEIVPTVVYPMPSRLMGEWLRDSDEKADVFRDVSHEFRGKHGKNPQDRNIEVAVSQTVFTMCSAFAQTIKFLELPDDSRSSPCSNVLLMAMNNEFGVVTEHILIYMVTSEVVKQRWLRPFICRCLEEHDDHLLRDAPAAVEKWFQQLCEGVRVYCPNDAQKKRRRALDVMNDWESEDPTSTRILVATKWPAEGIDIKHLHAVAPYPTKKYKDNLFDQLRSRACRAARRKRCSYLFMVERNSPKCVKKKKEAAVAAEEDLAVEAAAEEEAAADHAPMQCVCGHDVAGCGSCGKGWAQRADAAGRQEEAGKGKESEGDGASEGETESEDAPPGEDGDGDGDEEEDDGNSGSEVDPDCQGSNIGFVAALARASVYGGRVMDCFLMKPHESCKLRRGVTRMTQEIRTDTPTQGWHECTPFDEIPRDVPMAIIVLKEQKNANGNLVVAGILAPIAKEMKKSLTSTMRLDYIYGESAVPSFQELLERARLHLDGHKHGFVWKGDCFQSCRAPGEWYEHRVMKIRNGEPRDQTRPVELVKPDTLSSSYCMKIARACKESYTYLGDFDAFQSSFLIGSSHSVLTFSQKGSTTGNLAFSTDDMLNVSYLCVAVPFDLSLRPQITADMKRMTADVTAKMKLLHESVVRPLKSPRMPPPYCGDVVIVAVVSQSSRVEGRCSYGIVHVCPRLLEHRHQYCTIVARDVTQFELSSTCITPWQLKDHCFFRDEFKICDSEGNAWKWNSSATVLDCEPSTVACHLVDEEAASVFTCHPLNNKVATKWVLAVGDHSTPSFQLANYERPVSLRIQDRDGRQNGGCFQGGNSTQWFCFPASWLEGRTTCTLRKAEDCPQEHATKTLRVGSGYSAGVPHFDAAKNAGKDKANRILAKNADTTGFAIILDDIDPRTKLLRTTEALLAAGFQPERILLPNMDPDVYKKAHLKGLVAVKKLLLDALDDVLGNSAWMKNVTLVYYDNCVQGDWAEVEKNLRKLDLFVAPGGVLACTLLGRNFKGDKMTDRNVKLDALVTKLGYSPMTMKEGLPLIVDYGHHRVFFFKKTRIQGS
jgi:hypothetical protein